jgi:hypothetical protein
MQQLNGPQLPRSDSFKPKPFLGVAQSKTRSPRFEGSSAAIITMPAWVPSLTCPGHAGLVLFSNWMQGAAVV